MMQLRTACKTAQHTCRPCGVRLAAPCGKVAFPARRAIVVRVSEQPSGENKTLKRESEPDEYWVAKSEKPGANVFLDPVAIMGILAILGPFLILGVAVSAGVVDLSAYRGN